MIDIDNIPDDEINALISDEKPSGGQSFSGDIDSIDDADIDSLLAEGESMGEPIGESMEIAPKSPVINEPADISIGDRLFIKNFAPHNPEGAAKYLKEKYPNKEFTYNPDLGEITQLNQETGEEKPIDPSVDYYSTLFFDVNKLKFEMKDGELVQVGEVSDARKLFKEAVLDAGDIASDLAQAVISAGAALGGGLAGLPAGPAGALALGAAAAGVADAGMEAIRQVVGQAGGIPGNISKKHIAMSGGMGAVSTFLFGAKIGIQQFHKGALKDGTEKLVKDLAEKTIAQATAMDGVIGGAFTAGKKSAGFLAEKATGISRDLYKTYVDPAAQKILKALDNAGVVEISKEIGEEIHSLWNTKIRAFGHKLGRTRDNASVDINIEPVKKVYKDQIAHLKRTAKTPDDFRTIDNLVQEYDDLFINKKTMDIATAKRNEILDSQQKQIEFFKDRASQEKKQFSEVDQFLRNRKKELEIKRKEYKMSGRKEQDVLSHLDDIELQIKMDEKALGEKKLQSMQSNRIPVFREPPEPSKEYIDKVSGEEFVNMLQNIKESGKVWKDVEGKSKSADIALRTSIEAKTALNSELDKSLKNYPALRAEYRRLKNSENFVENFYEVGSNQQKVFEKKTYDYLTKGVEHPVVAENLMSFDKEFGTALMEKSKLLRTHKYLGKHPSKVRTFETVATRFAGIPVGAVIGGGMLAPYGGYWEGAIAGSSLAFVGLSPSAWKLYYGAGRGMKPFVEATYKSLSSKVAGRAVMQGAGGALSYNPPKPSLQLEGFTPDDDYEGVVDSSDEHGPWENY